MSEEVFVSSLIKQFQKRRYDLRLTQSEVDDRIGVTSGLVAKWEIGNRKPTMFNAYCWAEALNCEIRLEKKDGNLRD